MDLISFEAVMGKTAGLARYRALLPAYERAMRAAGITNRNRACMWHCQLGHESNGLLWMEELASGKAYEGRKDLGNTQKGDGVRFKGRDAIQVTGRHNYGKCSEYAHRLGLVPTPTYFVDHPRELSSDRYGFIGALWYWTVARKTLNQVSDRGDVVAATKLINGGTNGLADRQKRWKRAQGMGDRILVSPSGGTIPVQPPRNGKLLFLLTND